MELVISDKLEDKFDKLGIEAELSVSILAGLAKVCSVPEISYSKIVFLGVW